VNDQTGTRLAEEIAGAASASGRTIAVAESLTAGHTAAVLGAAPDASEWFRGGVVAYAPEVKFEVLGVTPGPVVRASCVREMALGVRDRLGADIAVAATGVGGPGPDEGQPAGTVYLACVGLDGSLDERAVQLDGPPERVVELTVILMLNLVYEALVEVAVLA
jgi:nicotinamide-nucleotide amidase